MEEVLQTRLDPGTPPGRLVDIGGYRMHIDARGEGAPTVVLEAAIWDFGLTWALVQPSLAEFTRVVSYDRAGLGWSDPSPRPRTVDVMVDELHALLGAAGIDPPYVLVAQSYGGLISRLYAYRHPDEVAGMVMVDSAHEEQFLRFPESIRKAWGPMSEMQMQQLEAAKAAIEDGTFDPALVPVPNLPTDVTDRYRALVVSSSMILATQIEEHARLEESHAIMREAAVDSFGGIPLRVLSHSVPPPGFPPEMGVSDEDNAAYEETWQELQREIAGLSSRGEHLVVEGAGHMIHHEHPEAVVAAIRSVVEDVR